MSVFDDAKAKINKNLISDYFPGGEWRSDGDYWVCSPLRADKKIGSFHITDAGIWHDFSNDDGGDFISLVSQAKGLTLKQAAEEISGNSPAPATAKKPKKEKIPACIPIPTEAAAALNTEIRSEYATKKHGAVAAGWRYHTAEGGWAFAVVRFNKADGGKDVIPYYYGVDSRWHEGQAYADARPLYNLPALAEAGEILIVEGEKCGSVTVSGYTLTTSSSGASSFDKTDWSPLTEAAAAGRVTIWPDADVPGMKYARGIANRLPGAKIMDIQGKPEGWDIADCEDPLAFIKECPLYAMDDTPDDETLQFFRCLGYDDERYLFLCQAKRSTHAITRGSFNASKLQELAPLSWWSLAGMVGDQGAIKVAIAQDYIIGKQDKVGRYNPDALRGAGVWHDNNEVIINDGRQIITRNGEKTGYAEYKTPWVYLSSSRMFGDMTGKSSTIDQGYDLQELMGIQGWTRPSAALAALGWALIAPFGGLLKWRPHIWITGRKGTGKSWVIENIIDELLGSFAYKGTGKSTEASIRRSLKTDACPVRLDEMEPKDQKPREKIASILDLERNASSDASGFMTICGLDGTTLEYRIRSCFCNASVRTPEMDAAVESRIIKCEMRALPPELMADKKRRTLEIINRSMRDPGIYMRRIFRALDRVLVDIELLRNGLLEGIGSQRDADQWAPLFAASWALVSDESISCDDGRVMIASFIKDVTALKDEIVEDEDRVIEHILNAQLDTDSREKRTVAELLVRADDYTQPSDKRNEAAELLARHGMRITKNKGIEVLAFSVHSDAITRILKDTTYTSGYDAQLRRHSLCLNTTEGITVHMGERSVRARLLKWAEFKEMYMGKAE